jgi:Ser/Thr protein kinase RdoA (MazF antagonist)
MGAEYSPEVVADLQVMVTLSRERWGLSAKTAIDLLNVSENATFAMSDVSDGRELVLRVHRVGYSSAEEIRSELAWIDALRDAGVIETLTPVPGGNGEYVQTLTSPSGRPSRHAVAFERLPGKEPDAGVDALSWFERLGEVSAKMHLHSKSWRLPAGFRRKRWDVEAMVGQNAYWGSWRDALDLDRAGTVVLEQALSRIEGRLLRFGEGAARQFVGGGDAPTHH